MSRCGLLLHATTCRWLVRPTRVGQSLLARKVGRAAFALAQRLAQLQLLLGVYKRMEHNRIAVVKVARHHVSFVGLAEVVVVVQL